MGGCALTGVTSRNAWEVCKRGCAQPELSGGDRDGRVRWKGVIGGCDWWFVLKGVDCMCEWEDVHGVQASPKLVGGHRAERRRRREERAVDHQEVDLRE